VAVRFIGYIHEQSLSWLGGAAGAVNECKLAFRLPLHSVPVTPNVVSLNTIQGEVYSIIFFLHDLTLSSRVISLASLRMSRSSGVVDIESSLPLRYSKGD
jgi:hypothetical protein